MTILKRLLKYFVLIFLLPLAAAFGVLVVHRPGQALERCRLVERQAAAGRVGEA